MFSISYPADEHYTTPSAAGVPAYENAKQVIAKKRRLVNLYAFNNSGAAVYLAMQDSANAGVDNGRIIVYPIGAGSFVSVAIHGGKRFENGIYLQAFTTAALGVAAGAVMFYDVDYMAYL